MEPYTAPLPSPDPWGYMKPPAPAPPPPPLCCPLPRACVRTTHTFLPGCTTSARVAVHTAHHAMDTYVRLGTRNEGPWWVAKQHLSVAIVRHLLAEPAGQRVASAECFVAWYALQTQQSQPGLHEALAFHSCLINNRHRCTGAAVHTRRNRPGAHGSNDMRRAATWAKAPPYGRFWPYELYE